MEYSHQFTAAAPVVLCGAICAMPAAGAREPGCSGDAGHDPSIGRQVVGIGLACVIYVLVALTMCAAAAWLRPLV